MYWDVNRELFLVDMRAHAHQHNRRTTHIPLIYFAKNLYLFNQQADDGVLDGFIYTMLTETIVSTIQPIDAEQGFYDHSPPTDYLVSSPFQAIANLPLD